MSVLLYTAKSAKNADEFIARVRRSALKAELTGEPHLLDALYAWEQSTPENKARFKNTGWFGIAAEYWEVANNQ